MSTYLYCMGTCLAISLFGRGLDRHSSLRQWGVVFGLAMVWPIFTPVGILIEIFTDKK